jgi:glyoxylase-like metal-dependent hydrolase (beta-lactamase superfamily II)
MKPIIEKAWLIPMGNVNGVLLEGESGELVLVDAGFPGHEGDVFEALTELGHQPEDLTHIVFTHAHPDHTGSAAAIVTRTGAETWMHPLDIAIAESGGPFRAMSPSPGLVQRILFRLFFHADETVAPVRIDHRIDDGQTLPIAGGLKVIHTPGHSAGHVALLWQESRLLIAGDVGSNMFGVSDPLGFEDFAQGRASQRKLASLTFEAAAFGHGRAISADAMKGVRRGWGSPSRAQAA